MKYFIEVIFIVDTVLAFYYVVNYHIAKKIQSREEKLFVRSSFASGIWSIGFGLLPIQTDSQMAYYCRSFGMLGVFMYLIFALLLVCYISNLGRKMRNMTYSVALLGIPLFFLVTAPSVTEYYMSKDVMTYRFKPGIANGLYTAYTCILAMLLFAIVIYTIKTAELKRIKDFSKKMIWVGMLLVFGMVLDTIFPMLGYPAIPGSSITQFWAILLLNYALKEKKKSEVNVHNMSEFIYNSLANPVVVYDSKRNIKIANDAATTFFKIEEMKKQKAPCPITYLFDMPEDEVFVFDGENNSFDAKCIRNNKECNVSVSKIDDKYGDLIGYIFMITDVSERKKTLLSLEKAKEEADAANRAKSMFLANMSHEIRTPMNSILGFAELALNNAIDDSVREYVGDIRRSANTLLSLINEILDISKIESGNMELVETEYLLENILKDVYLIVGMQAEKKKLEFEFEVENEVPRKLLGDKSRVREVLINILGNAVKYTEKGSVTLKIKTVSKSFDIVELEFDVIDTGIGIKKEDIKSIFESFSRVDLKNTSKIEGTGLGLALTKGYLELMEGSLDVESEYEKGSTFKAKLKQKIVDDIPMTFSKDCCDREEKTSLGNMKLKDTSVLVVDDNPINLKVIQHTLIHYGLVVDVAESGFEAIKQCESKQFDIIFMDQMMPDMDGIESMKEIRRINSCYADKEKCKIIVLTANAISGARMELIKEGFDEYLSKPIDYNMLEEIFEKLVPKEKIYYVNESEKGKNINEKTKEKGDVKMSNTLEKLKEIIDVEKGLAYCTNSEDIYLKVLALFVKNTDKQVRDIKNFYEEKDIKNFTIIVHAIKGSCLNVGADEQAVVPKDLEMAGKRDDMPYIEERFDKFISEHEAFVNGIKDILVAGGVEIPVDKKASLEEYFEKILDCVDSFDVAGMSTLMKEMKENLADEDLEKIKELEPLIDDVDMDGIAEWVEKNE